MTKKEVRRISRQLAQIKEERALTYRELAQEIGITLDPLQRLIKRSVAAGPKNMLTVRRYLASLPTPVTADVIRC